MKKAAPFFIVVFSVIFLFSGSMILKELIHQKKDIDNFHQLTELITVQPTAPHQPEHPTQPQNDETLPVASEPAAVRNLAPLFDRNKDCVGWLYIEGTQVNYPVMHTPDAPEQYLHKNFDRQYSAAGVPFIDASCALDSGNLIIYGHNMKNGTMFADITKYRNKDYYTEHPTIELETAQGIRQYSIFAVIPVKNDDSWYFFRTADNEAEYHKKVEEAADRALYDTGIIPTYGRQLLTLSTCYGANKDDRIIVIAVETNQ